MTYLIASENLTRGRAFLPTAVLLITASLFVTDIPPAQAGRFGNSAIRRQQTRRSAKPRPQPRTTNQSRKQPAPANAAKPEQPHAATGSPSGRRPNAVDPTPDTTTNRPGAEPAEFTSELDEDFEDAQTPNDPDTQQSEEQRPKELTTADVLRVALSIEAALGNPDRMDEIMTFSADEARRRVVNYFDAFTPQKMCVLRPIIERLLPNYYVNLHAQADRIADGGEFTYVSHEITGRTGRVIFRVRNRYVTQSYIEFYVYLDGDGEAVVGDYYLHEEAIWYSRHVADEVLRELRKNPLAVRTMNAAERERVDGAEALRRADQLFSARDFEAARDAYHALPDRMKRERPEIRIYAILASYYAEEIDAREASRQIRNTPSYSALADLMLYWNLPDDTSDRELLAADRRLIGRFGEDATLLRSAAITLMASGGSLSRAMTYLERAAEAEPNRIGIYLTAMRLQSEHGAPDDVLAWLRRADDAVHPEWPSLKKIGGLEKFLDTPQYQQWQTELGKRAPQEPEERFARRPIMTAA